MSLMESLNGKKKKKRATVTISFKEANRAVAGKKRKKKRGELWFCDIFLEREKLLFKISGDQTVKILWGKKESCSKRRSLRVDSGFEEF